MTEPEDEIDVEAARRQVHIEVARTAARLRGDSQETRARAQDRLADAEHALEERMLDVAEHTPDPGGTRRRGHAWSARAEEHRDRADELRG